MHSIHYPSDSVYKKISKGIVKKFCSDTVEYVVIKKNEKSSFITSDVVEEKIKKVLSMGVPEYGGKTNGGYSFSIYIYDKKDDTKTISTLFFKVDQDNNKINTIYYEKQ